MALGTITINKVHKFGNSSELLVDVSVQGDDSYPTGGTAGVEATIKTALAAGSNPGALLGNYDLLGVEHIDALADVGRYDAANDKLIVRNMSDGAEKGNGTDQSGTTYRFLAKLA